MALLNVQFEEGKKGEPMVRLWKTDGQWKVDGRGHWTPAVVANKFKKVKAGEIWQVEIEAEINDRDTDKVRLVLLKPVHKCTAGVTEIGFDGATLEITWLNSSLELNAKKDEPLAPVAWFEIQAKSDMNGFQEWREFIEARKVFLEKRIPDLEREREEKIGFLAQPSEKVLFDVRVQEGVVMVETCEGSWTLAAEEHKGTLSIVPRGEHHDFADMGPVWSSYSGFEVKTVGGVPVKELPKFLRWNKIVLVVKIEETIRAYFEAEAKSLRWQEYEWPITHGAHSEENIKKLARELEILKGLGGEEQKIL